MKYDRKYRNCKCVTTLVLCFERLGIWGVLYYTHPDTHFCKQSFPLGEFLILDDSRGPSPLDPPMHVRTAVCPSQVLGFGLGLLSQITSQKHTAGPNTPRKHVRGMMRIFQKD